MVEKEEFAQHVVDILDVLSHLAVKIDDLSNNIIKLLKLFEESAKSLQEKRPEMPQEKEMPGVVKTLLDQNKIIAKSLSLIEERTRQAPYQPPQSYAPYNPQQQYQQPRLNVQHQGMTPSQNLPTQTQNPQPDKKPKPLPT